MSDAKSVLPISWFIKVGLLLAAVCLGMCYLYLQRTSTVYSSGTELVVTRVELFGARSHDGGSSRFTTTQVEIARSATVIEAALKRAPLPSNEAASAAEGGISQVNYVQLNLLVSLVENTQVLLLSYTSPTNGYGVEFLNALVHSYRDYVKGVDEEIIKVQLAGLRDQEAELRQQLRDLQTANLATAVQSDDVANYQDTEHHNRMASTFEERLHLLTGDIDDAKLELQRLQRGIASGELMSSPERYLRNSEAALELSKERLVADRLQTTLFSSHPDVANSLARIKRIETQVVRQARAEQESLITQIDALTRQREDTQAAMLAANAAAQTLRDNKMENERLLSEIKSVETMLETVTASIGEALRDERAFYEGLTGTVIGTIKQPAQEDAPIWPMPIAVYSMGLLAAVLMTIALWFLLRERRLFQLAAPTREAQVTSIPRASDKIREAAKSRL